MIEFLHVKGKTFTSSEGKTNDEIESELDSVYGNRSPSIAIAKWWATEFGRDRTNIFDEDLLGRTKEVTTEEMIEKIHDIVLHDPQVKVRDFL